MLPNNTAVSLIQNHLRNQQGVIEVAKPVSDGQLLLTVGDRVQATVTSQLPNGRFAVLVKDQLLDLNLPRNTQPGEKMDLTVLSAGSRPSFALANSASPQPAQTSANAGVALSQAGKMLGELLVRAEGQPRLAQVQQNQPLFEGRPLPAQLAGQLATRLAESGLFYESHQAGWVNGERSLQALMREPQAQWAQGSARNGEAARPETAGKSTPAEMLVQRGSSEMSAAQLQRPDQAARQMVQQQMELLENNPLVWQGQAWPGQPLRWKLELENEREAQLDEGAAARIWQTRLDLDLPHLGAVGVVASLRDGQFTLRFEAQEAGTVDALKSRQSQLAERFAAAGLALISSQVLQHDQENSA